MQVGPVRHTIAGPREPAGAGLIPGSAPGGRPTPVLHVHATGYAYTGNANPSAPGGMTLIYKDMIADKDRNGQVVADVADALARDRNCLVLTNWTTHLQALAGILRELAHDPVQLKGGMGTKERAAAVKRLEPQPGGPPLVAIATSQYAGEGFDCPPLDTLFFAAPVSFKGRLIQNAGRILRTYDGKTTAEIHDYHDELTRVLASSLAKRAPGYTSLGFPDPRKLPYTPSVGKAVVHGLGAGFHDAVIGTAGAGAACAGPVAAERLRGGQPLSSIRSPAGPPRSSQVWLKRCWDRCG
jgi:hypothetical protein